LTEQARRDKVLRQAAKWENVIPTIREQTNNLMLMKPPVDLNEDLDVEWEKVLDLAEVLVEVQAEVWQEGMEGGTLDFM
jgi:hypothetical protein